MLIERGEPQSSVLLFIVAHGILAEGPVFPAYFW
jgi:hypothetical protein